MKKFIPFPLLFTALVLVSCGSSDTPEVDKSIVPANSPTTVTGIVADSAEVAQFANSVNPTQSTVTPAAAPAQNVTAAKTSGSSAANPAHGQPGHRCDIAVGAPLNSPLVKPAQPTVQPSVTTAPATSISAPSVITPAAATPVSTDPNAKLNPAHGQPGHDCSLAVGAPLKKN